MRRFQGFRQIADSLRPTTRSSSWPPWFSARGDIAHLVPPITGAPFRHSPASWDHTKPKRADYFDSCRKKRNVADYDAAGMISDAEVKELLEEIECFRNDVLSWLDREHPDLV